MGVDWRDRKLIWNLYNGQKAHVRIGEEQSGVCSVGRGVRQGCSLSPLLFIIYDEAMVKEATSNSERGVHVGGQAMNMIRYADDKAVVLVCNTEKGLQELMNNLNRVTKEYGMKINARKTKVMCISNKGRTKVSIYIN